MFVLLILLILWLAIIGRDRTDLVKGVNYRRLFQVCPLFFVYLVHYKPNNYGSKR